MTSDDVVSELVKLSNQHRAESGAWFFRTEKGGYGEGDKFLGVRVPQSRKVAKEFRELGHDQLVNLLNNQYHEARLTALHIMCDQFRRGDEAVKVKIFNIYDKNISAVNNWDLVDSSAPYIPGPYLFDRNRTWLYKQADSGQLWRERISIISTFYFIGQGDYSDTLNLSEKLLNHQHDLIHKAVGWMLREVGNRDREVEEVFLREHYQEMPRTMLRYAIEKFPEPLRQDYLKGRI